MHPRRGTTGSATFRLSNTAAGHRIVEDVQDQQNHHLIPQPFTSASPSGDSAHEQNSPCWEPLPELRPMTSLSRCNMLMIPPPSHLASPPGPAGNSMRAFESPVSPAGGWGIYPGQLPRFATADGAIGASPHSIPPRPPTNASGPRASTRSQRPPAQSRTTTVQESSSGARPLRTLSSAASAASSLASGSLPHRIMAQKDVVCSSVRQDRDSAHAQSQPRRESVDHASMVEQDPTTSLVVSMEQAAEEIRQQASLISDSVPRHMGLTMKQAIQGLQQAIRALVTCRGAADMGSVPSLLLTTYNIVCKQVFHSANSVVLSKTSEFAQQPRSLFDAFESGGEDTTLATELRDQQRELVLTKKHYHVAIQQIDIFKHRLKEHVVEIRRLEKLIETAASVELELRSQIASLNNVIVRKDIEVSELKANILALHSSMHDVQKTDTQRISERTADLRTELASLYDQIRQGEELTKSFENEVHNLQSDLKRANDNFEDSQKENLELQFTLQQRDDELYKAKEAAHEMSRKMASLEANISDLLVVQGDAMVQDKMIAADARWLRYKDIVTAKRRAVKADGLILPLHIKTTKGLGTSASVPQWLHAEGKVKPKFINRGDSIHVALQCLSDMCFPASLATNLRVLALHLVTAASAAIDGARVDADSGGAVKGSRGSISIRAPPGSQLSDELAIATIGSAALGNSKWNAGSSRRSLAGGLGSNGGGITADELASRMPFSDAFKLWLSRSGTDIPNHRQGTELAYGFIHTFRNHIANEPDLQLFDAVLCGDVPPELHYHIFYSVDMLLRMFITADEEMHNGQTRRAIPVTTVARVVKKVVELPQCFATAADAEHLLFLLTIDYNVPYIPYRNLFDYDEDGDRHLFLHAFVSLVVKRSLEYYDTLQEIIESLAKRNVTLLSPPALALKDDEAPLVSLVTDVAPPSAVVSVSSSPPPPHDDDSQHEGEEPTEKDVYPGYGFSKHPMPDALQSVDVSLHEFGQLWVAEDPLKAREMPHIVQLLRILVGAMEEAAAAAKAAAEDAAKAAAQTKTRRGVTSVALPTATPRRATVKKAEPAVAAVANPVAAPPRDLVPAGLLLRVIRSLVVTRSSHRAFYDARNETTVDIPDTDNDVMSVSGGSVASTNLLAPHAAGGSSEFGALDAGPLGVPPAIVARPDSSVAPMLSKHGEETELVIVPEVSFEVDLSALPPPPVIVPLFDLGTQLHDLEHTVQRINPALHSVSTSQLQLPREHTGSVTSLTSPSIAGGVGPGNGAHGGVLRVALQALAKRNQTNLPPFFKARMMRS